MSFNIRIILDLTSSYMLLANTLKIGDTIWFIAPSYPTPYPPTEDQKDLLNNAIQKFEKFGFKTLCSKNCFAVDKYGISAWTPQQRADDLNEMFANPEIKAIYCVNGWATANQILSLIDYQNIQKNPKIFLGMSDVDVLHLAINTKTDLITFNGINPKAGRKFGLDDEYTWNSFQERMIKKSKKIPASSERICVRKGSAEGKVIGCNLATMLKLAGTDYFPNFENTILFLEENKANIEKTISRLQQLKEIWVFNKIKWIVIGYIYGFQDEKKIIENNIAVKYEDIVLDITKEFDFPILKTNDFGHRCPNCYVPIGAQVKMDAEKKTIELVGEFLI